MHVIGEGFDRHLFALKYLSQQRSLPLPSLYQDAAYAAINYNILSNQLGITNQQNDLIK